jgi:hypothetical protein
MKKSKFRISFHKGVHKWQVVLVIGKKPKHFGYFESYVNAVISRNQALQGKHGAFGLLLEWMNRLKSGEKKPRKGGVR